MATNREKLLNKLNSYNNKEFAIFMYHHNISTCDENNTEDWGIDGYEQWLSQETEDKREGEIILRQVEEQTELEDDEFTQELLKENKQEVNVLKMSDGDDTRKAIE